MKATKNKNLSKWFTLMFGLLMLLSFNNKAQSNFVVTSITDPAGGGTSVPGQLRWAIEQANLVTGPSIISFNIVGTAPFTITPNATLPVIVKSVYIDGTTQPGYNFSDPGNPVIIIDGTLTTTALVQGLAFNNASGSKLTGIYLREFVNGLSLEFSNNCEITNNVINRMNYVSILMSSSSFCIIKGNYINTDKNLTAFSIKSEEGLFITASNDNIIGGTNCGEANTFAYMGSEAIDNYPSPGQRNLYSGNIFLINDANYNPNYEILLRGTGNGGKTYPTIVTTGCTTSGTSQANDVIQVFGSTGSNADDPTNYRTNANVYMGKTNTDANGNWSIALSDVKYPYVIATATNSLNNTSEFCVGKVITKDTLKLVISKPSSICVGENVTFENSISKCKGTLNFSWNFGDGSPITSTSNHIYTSAGTYTVSVTVPESNNCASKSATSVITVAQCAAFDCAAVPPPCTLTASAVPSLSPSYYWSFSVTASGGTPPYTYLWFNPSANLLPISNTTSTTVTTAPAPIGPAYQISVTVTDSNGCTVTKLIDIGTS
ncbi:MAG: PKD domain-containing protein [Bacteroidetes bacterium]|nr:PKD domain-containing protein [Bacteroidota bacterium]